MGSPPGKEDHRGAEGGQVGQKRLSLFRCQLIGVKNVPGIGVTVDALQVAPPCHVPDDDGALVRGKLQEMGGKLL